MAEGCSMEDYMAEIDSGKPPLTGTELRMAAQSVPSPEMKLRQQLMVIVINAVNDANVMRAVDELERLVKREAGLEIRSMEFPNGSPADAQ
jgi:hypothetical protein